MQHFRAMILMSFNEDLYSYHPKKIYKRFYSLKSVKNQNEFINLHVHLLVEQRALYKHF